MAAEARPKQQQTFPPPRLAYAAVIREAKDGKTVSEELTKAANDNAIGPEDLGLIEAAAHDRMAQLQELFLATV